MSQRKEPNILVLMAHPAIDQSRVNRPMFDMASQLPGVTAIDLYARYPRFDIDVKAEQAQLVEHDVLIFQHPLYWYSTPAILKEWQDLVLEYGFAYGKSGNALQGKRMMCAISAGGRAVDYQLEGSKRNTIAQLLRPLEQTASFCSMQWLEPFVMYNAIASDNADAVTAHLANWQALLENLQEGKTERVANG